jgi:hypothetical protein
MKILPKPPPEMTLPIAVETYQRLLTASARTHFEKETWEIGAIAIHDWLARKDPEALTMPIADGQCVEGHLDPLPQQLRLAARGEPALKEIARGCAYREVERPLAYSQGSLK